jgi:acyl-CoA synthetase (AMP-forming)/AMP-acid ligase II
MDDGGFFWMDDGGFFYFLARVKQMIKSSAFNV